MNSRDYKEIARIISIHPLSRGTKNSIVCMLADYFEREDNCKSCGYTEEEHKDELSHSCNKFIPNFNRKQFLKEAGVE